MNILQLPLEEVHPYKNNPRKNDNAVDAVAASIRQYGFLVPLVISAEHEIIAGHTRYKAAGRLGLSTVPCVIADELTEDQIKAFRLADNKVGELAQWDTGLPLVPVKAGIDCLVPSCIQAGMEAGVFVLHMEIPRCVLRASFLVKVYRLLFEYRVDIPL